MIIRPTGNIFRLRAVDSVCWRCSLGLSNSRLQNIHTSRSFTQSFTPRNTAAATPGRLKAGYFLSNGSLPQAQDGRVRRSSATTAAGGRQSESSASASTTPISRVNHDLPHRRRQEARRKAAAASRTSSGAADDPLPTEDASSALTTSAAKHSARSIRRQLSLYLSLSKPRLSILVVLTSMCSYAIFPVPDFLSPSIGLDTPSLSPLTLAFLTTGTALCAASANTLNMLYEAKTDAMMTRTRNRPLVRGLLSQRKAAVFAIATAAVGIGALYFGVNPTVAFLGATNIALYAGVYTPMKRMHWLNTWVGALVGGIPPLMGWAAAAGESATGTGSFQELLFTPDAIGGWLLASLLFAWQFPHFMALSWNIRADYKAAGHQMLAWVNPARNGRVALRYSIAFLPICLGLCAVGVTEWSFAVTSLPVNLWLIREAVQFHKHEGFHGSARGLFWASVWHLPVLMVLALCQKKGMWGRVWRAAFGEPTLDEEEEEWDDDDIDEVVPIPVPVERKK